jgi:uncharacterized membrane protein
MNRFRHLTKLLPIVVAGVLPQFGACVTTNQLKDFVRTEIAIVATQIVTDPINGALADLTGPQVVEEVVPSI